MCEGLWKSNIVHQGFQTHSFGVIMTLCPFSRSPVPSLSHPEESTFKTYSELPCFTTSVPAQAATVPGLVHYKDRQLISLLPAVSLYF